jgi:hypothetical protein
MLAISVDDLVVEAERVAAMGVGVTDEQGRSFEDRSACRPPTDRRPP